MSDVDNAIGSVVAGILKLTGVEEAVATLVGSLLRHVVIIAERALAGNTQGALTALDELMDAAEAAAEVHEKMKFG